MKTIYKYEVKVSDSISIDLPSGFKILKFKSLNINHITMWAIVETINPLTKMSFSVLGTGHNLYTMNSDNYIDTIQDKDGFHIWHIFAGIIPER